MNFKPGDFVSVTTVDRGRRAVRESARVETWPARIIGPSAMGDGWWIVRRVDPATGHVHIGGSPITVPQSEMSR